MAAVTSQATNSQDNPLADFGPNEWIVDDMYQRYLADPASVDAAWHDFFADYKPADALAGGPAPAGTNAAGVATNGARPTAASGAATAPATTTQPAAAAAPTTATTPGTAASSTTAPPTSPAPTPTTSATAAAAAPQAAPAPAKAQ